ncbi:tRNA (adenosine(37)-N6)-threonylcarbamoyltransferase complex dimerization subunit type 1 TsaB [Patescibacteria group bacterium]|nr:tRNA (adenosine(37)-N6)-threonylcarbamoyltransferase complex dimerization subunit type 1 TsaB [Patescibacteria group bacterium]
MKKNKILAISTCDPEKTAILLGGYSYTSGITPRRCKCGGAKITGKKVWRARTHQSEELLPAIDKLLKQNKVKTENLGLVVVNIGPGSFTSTRVGVATANALSFGLGIPVVGVKDGEKEIKDILKVGFDLFKKGKIKKGILAKPFYDKAPNITSPKK